MASIQYLANNLKFLRTMTGRTQDDLAVLLNISRQAYSNYEAAKRTPGLDTLLRLSALYHVSVDVLLGVDLSAFPTRYAGNAIVMEEQPPYGEKGSGYEDDMCLFCLTKEEAEFITKLRVLPPSEREKFFSLSRIFFKNP